MYFLNDLSIPIRIPKHILFKNKIRNFYLFGLFVQSDF